MHITSPLVSEYATQYSTEEDAILYELALETKTNVPGSQMLSGHLQGTFLTMISQILRPECILEIGTYTGYSAICLAKGLDTNGSLHTIDIDDRWNELRKKYWKIAQLDHLINLHIGDAHSIIPDLNIKPDLVFIDADKKGYSTYFDMIIELMPKGGIIIADNVLFKGEVVLPMEEQKNTTKHIHQFNIKIATDPRVEKVILPIRDGISLIRKK